MQICSRVSPFSSRLPLFFACVTLSLGAVGCGSDASDDDGELITMVGLTFMPVAGGASVVVTVNDPDGDGGKPPVVEPLTLMAGMYRMDVTFENRLAMPPENLTKEVRDEADEHQVFFTGTAVNGPSSDQPNAPLLHAYADTDVYGLPIGMGNQITASKGSGLLTLTLRHLPRLNGKPVKTAALAAAVRSGGFAAIGGATDVQVTFPTTVE